MDAAERAKRERNPLGRAVQRQLLRASVADPAERATLDVALKLSAWKPAPPRPPVVHEDPFEEAASRLCAQLDTRPWDELGTEERAYYRGMAVEALVAARYRKEGKPE